MNDGQFGARLAYLMKTLTLSNGHLASAPRVHKSVVGRWVSDAVVTSGVALGVAGDRHSTRSACVVVMQRIAGLDAEGRLASRELMLTGFDH